MNRLAFTAVKNPDGKTVRIVNRREFDRYVRMTPRQEFTLTIEPKRRNRSSPQNRYMWGVLYPIAAKALSEAWGHPVSSDDAHYFLRTKFWFTEDVDFETGEVVRNPKSTTEMTTTDMMTYQEDCRNWVNQYLGCDIPPPGEQVEMEIE